MTINKSKMKTPGGKLLTQSLFYELVYEVPDYAIYTLKDEDIEVTINPPSAVHGL
jgi:hypothetical protein